MVTCACLVAKAEAKKIATAAKTDNKLESSSPASDGFPWEDGNNSSSSSGDDGGSRYACVHCFDPKKCAQPNDVGSSSSATANATAKTNMEGKLCRPSMCLFVSPSLLFWPILSSLCVCVCVYAVLGWRELGWWDSEVRRQRFSNVCMHTHLQISYFFRAPTARHLAPCLFHHRLLLLPLSLSKLLTLLPPQFDGKVSSLPLARVGNEVDGEDLCRYWTYNKT